MMTRNSMTVRFLLPLFIVLLIGQSLCAMVLISYLRSDLSKSLEKRMNRTATILAGVSSAPLVSSDYVPLDFFLEELLRDDDIVALRIIDRAGQVVRERMTSREYDLGSISPFTFRKGMTVRMPVNAAGALVGEVVIDYNAKSINRNITEVLTVTFLFQVVVFFVVGIVMIWILRRTITKPVSGIGRAIEKITAGNLTAEVPDPGESEIGSIARGISFLSERLSATIVKINSTAQNISTTIKEMDTAHHNVIAGASKESEAVKEVIRSTQDAARAHAEIVKTTDQLSGFSSENLSSLIELKATSEEIARNTQRLFRATEESYAVVAKMTAGAREIVKSSSEALSAVEDTSASVEEIGASVRGVGENVKESSGIAEKLREVTSNEGMMSVVDAIEGMEGISTQVNSSSEIIERLSSRSADIEKVLSVIKDVTEQTNLLSLNAAILAAQAGEYGRSFSVVADEMSSLSDRTATSTREIGGIVKTIQGDIRDAVMSIDSVRGKVDEGNSLVLKLGEVLREILHESERSSDMTKAIERATEEQSAGLVLITKAVEEIRKMMNSIAKATAEQENALSYLLEGLGEVKEVADLSKRGTEEQEIGTKGISKNLELADGEMRKIVQAVADQRKLNEDIISAMERINSIGGSAVGDMEETSVSLKTLYGEIELLKKEMEVFKLR